MKQQTHVIIYKKLQQNFESVKRFYSKFNQPDELVYKFILLFQVVSGRYRQFLIKRI